MSPAPQRPSSLTAADLVAHLGGLLQGDPGFAVTRFQPLDSAEATDASFLAHDKYLPSLAKTRAGLVVLPPRLQTEGQRFRACILADQPYLYFAQAAQYLLQHARSQTVLATEVHASAVVHASAQIGSRVRIGPLAVVEEDVVVSDDTDIGAGVLVGRASRIGTGSQIHAGVRIGHGVQLGARAVIHSGAVLGSDGFGFAPAPDGAWVKIPQVGGVWIGDDVEIG
ncbi:MAG: UDP-3-O-(3-hydroxymyristoyl)glucosamine N-acyltransferase, partial [Burkholderiaceae bacterium]